MRWVGYLAIGLVLLTMVDTGAAATPPPDLAGGNWLEEQADAHHGPLGQPDAHDCADLARQLLCMLGVGH